MKSLTDTEDLWTKVGVARDLDKFVSFYSDDAVVLFPNEAPMVGPAAISAGLKPLMADPNFGLTFHASKAEVAKSGDIGYTHGPYTMTSTNPITKKVVTDKGTYVTCWRKDASGAWKATLDTTISEIAAAGK